VAGLGPIHQAGDALWVGSLGGSLGSRHQEQLAKNKLIDVPLRRETARRHYEGFSNGVLWPLFHYFLESTQFDPQDYEAYRDVNAQFADIVASHARPGDRIWVHDYHLMLLPSMLRERLSDVAIGFFLHIPFPSSEVFRVLPVKQEILEGLLGADLIGVHTHAYVRHLSTSYRRFLALDQERDAIEWQGRRCYIRPFPLGVDAVGLSRRARSKTAERRLAAWRRRVGDRAVILGVDRLDYSKGIPVRLRAYRRLLAKHPEWRRKVQFLQLAVPTRGGISKYRDLKRTVEGIVGEINGEFADLGDNPVQYMHRSVSPEELGALYRLADVAVVTPLRDGMNLVAKEFVASRQDDTGVLVLSEFAGASTELGEALVVNPFDTDGTVAAIDRALRMGSKEMKRRMSALRRRVGEHDARHWADEFIEALDAFSARPGVSMPADDERWQRKCVEAFGAARRPLVVLSYDGTLREFEEDPSQAEPDTALLGLVRRLAEVPGAELVFLSGRDRGSLIRWLGDLPVHLVSEHGFFLRLRGHSEWEDMVPGLDRSWLPLVEEAMESFVARTPGSFIERKQAGISWHYRSAEPAHGLRQARELAHHLTEYFANRALHVLQGQFVIEVKSQAVDKGSAFRIMSRRLPDADFVLAAGDDRSDEDTFRASPAGAWSIKIGPGLTSARYRLESPERFRALLTAALDAREGIAAPEQDSARASKISPFPH